MAGRKKAESGRQVQRIVCYSGQVQGVGFRYTACRVAEGYMVAGYVRNLPDRRVEVLAEGQASEVEGFLNALHREMGPYIDQATTNDGFPTGQYTDFRVEYY